MEILGKKKYEILKTNLLMYKQHKCNFKYQSRQWFKVDYNVLIHVDNFKTKKNTFYL